MKRKYPIYSDTHFNFTFPWTQYDFVSCLAEENPSGLIITGDISCGITIEKILAFLSRKLECPIYFILGNHDYYSTSIKLIHEKIKKLCKQRNNLIWMSDVESIALKDDVCIVGDDGWYDARLGNPSYLAYNFDWIMIDEFRQLKSFEEKLSYSRKLADQSAANIKSKLEKALEKYQTIYLMTHMPPYGEASRGLGTALEEFWLPYNINYHLGKMIEEIMQDHHDQKVIVLSGHTHVPAIINVSHNIECVVQGGKYLGPPTEHNCIFI